MTRLDYQPPKLQAPDHLSMYIEQLRTFIRDDVLPMLRELTSDLLFWDGLGLLNGDSPLPAWNLFGNPRPGLLGQVSLSSIGDFNPNLLADPLFGWSGSVDDPLGEWVVDTAVRHVDPLRPETEQGNSLRVVPDGIAHDLLSDPELPVTPGQRVEMTIYARWVDLVSAGGLTFPFQFPATFRLDSPGSPVRLSVIGYDAIAGGNQILDTVIATAGSNLPANSVDHPDADDEGWVPLSATFVVPESVRSIRMSPQVTADATAGTGVWFSDASQQKTQRLGEGFVEGLAEKLVGFDLDGFFDSSRLAGLIEQSRIAGLVDRISGLDGNGFLDSSRLAGALEQAQLNIPNVQDIIDRIVEGGGGSGIGNAVDTVRDRVRDIFDVANRADQNVIDIQASVQQLVDDTSAGASGNSNSVVFSGADGAALTGFTVGPNFDSIVIRNDGSTVTAGMKAGSGDGRAWAVFDTTQYATDDQSVSGVLGRNGSSEVSLTLTNRTDPLMTNGAFCNAQKDNIAVGYWTRSGSSFAFNNFASVDRTTKIGARVELRSVGNNYFVLVNGVQVLGVTDTGNNVTIGASNRCAGFVEGRDTLGLFNTVHYSFWLASFAMADYAPGGSIVPNWHLMRASTATVALNVTNGGYGLVPSNFFTLQDSASGVTVTNLGQGAVRVDSDGWWEISFSFIASSHTSGTSNLWAPPWALFKNGSQFTGSIAVGVSKKVYLVQGDVIRPAAAATNTTTQGGLDIFFIRGFSSFSGKLVT